VTPQRDTAKCPVPLCGGRLRFTPDAIGRLVGSCDDCARRARLEYEARFGAYLAKVRQESIDSGGIRRCDHCGDKLLGRQKRFCDKPACRHQRWVEKHARAQQREQEREQHRRGPRSA
jgi:hypothetical protein